MTNIVFAPYVGPRFQDGPVRLLLVGESHYGDPDHDPFEATRTVVRKWQTREWAIRFLTVGARILTGQQAWQVDRCGAFADVAFYNFIQVAMPTVRHRPTREQGLASWAAFREVLANLDPTHIVATGPGFLWSVMPPSDRRSDQVALGGVVLPRREYLTPSGMAPVVVIPHLSRASAPRWQASIREFLASQS